MRCLVVSALILSLGCAAGTSVPQAGQSGAEGQRGGGVVSGFPQQGALDELLEQPLPPESALAERYSDVDTWELAGPFPDQMSAAPRTGARPWDALVDELVASRAGLVVATESMDCFAREVGRFMVSERGIPGVALQRFAAGRCGVATLQPAFTTFGWSPMRARDAADAVQQLREQIARQLAEHVVGGPLELGVWLSADGERVDLLIATGERIARIDPVPSVPGPDGRVRIAGELLKPAQSLGGAVTHGRFEWAECEVEPGVALPRFRLSCPIAPGDATAWIAVDYLPPERLLGRVALSLLVRPQGGDARRFQRDSYAPARTVTDAAELPAALLELVNGVRQDAGLGPLALDPAQSGVASEIAPYYFAGLLGEAPQSVADLVALGMMAGWEVDGIVQDGSFTWAWLVESQDVSRLLSDALGEPGSRATLLAPDADRIALGGRLGAGGDSAGSYVAVIASTYALFSEATHQRDVEKVRALLASARAARDHAAPGSLDAAAPLASRRRGARAGRRATRATCSRT